MKENHYEVVIIGGGISGSAAAYVLARYTDIKSVAIVEKYEGLSTLNSKCTANSQTIHCGDIETNYTYEKAAVVSKKANMISKYGLQHGLNEKHMFAGQKMAIGVGDEECEKIKARYEEFKTLYPYLEFFDKETLKQIEPKIIFDKDGKERPENVVGMGSRGGVGAFDLIDDDKVCLTNLNRQIIATRKTIGKYKTDVMKERILDINPDADVRIHQCFFLPENADDFPFEEYDYIVDAVDTVTAKIALVMKAKELNVPIISSMGAGNKLDGSQFKVADIYKTKVCPLAKVMRRELKKRGVRKLKVVYSEEVPTRPIEDMSISCRTHCICPPGAAHKCTERRDIPGSVAFVPSVAGLIIAGEVVKDLCKKS